MSNTHIEKVVKSPCRVCGYGGEALDTPPCTECPAHPKVPSRYALSQAGHKVRIKKPSYRYWVTDKGNYAIYEDGVSPIKLTRKGFVPEGSLKDDNCIALCFSRKRAEWLMESLKEE